MEEYNNIYLRVQDILNRNFRRMYVVFFNAYAWFSLINMLFIKELTIKENWEDYLLWFFAVSGMYFFFLDNKSDLLVDIKDKNRR